MVVEIRYKCGHTEKASFEYPQAAADWQKWARSEQCPKCSRPPQAQ